MGSRPVMSQTRLAASRRGRQGSCVSLHRVTGRSPAPKPRGEIDGRSGAPGCWPVVLGCWGPTRGQVPGEPDPAHMGSDVTRHYAADIRPFAVALPSIRYREYFSEGLPDISTIYGRLVDAPVNKRGYASEGILAGANAPDR